MSSSLGRRVANLRITVHQHGLVVRRARVGQRFDEIHASLFAAPNPELSAAVVALALTQSGGAQAADGGAGVPPLDHEESRDG